MPLNFRTNPAQPGPLLRRAELPDLLLRRAELPDLLLRRAYCTACRATSYCKISDFATSH